MTRTQISAIAIALSAIVAGPAIAADNGPATRAQVKAELAEAIQNGTMVYDEIGQTFRDFYPHNYASEQNASKSRAEVSAELAHAIETGNVSFDEYGRNHNEFFVHNYEG